MQCDAMRIDVLTLFPKIFPGYLGQSLLHKAIERKIVEIEIHNFRDWSTDKQNKVDDRPFGGGPGMILMVEPVVVAVEAVQKMAEPAAHPILLTPQGRKLDQPTLERIAQHQRLLLLCGRYEGFDQRVVDLVQPEEISLGDFVLSGGEVAALVLIDAVVRLIPGVLGDEASSWDDSFSRGNRLLEYPQYTRPREFRGLTVPEILLSGNHLEIEKWRREQSLAKTRLRRSDLIDENIGPHSL